VALVPDSKTLSKDRRYNFSPIVALAVEPNIRLHRLYKETLDGLGFGGVFCVADPAQALAVLIDTPINLMLIDMFDQHDRPSGLAFVRQIRRSSDRRRTLLPIAMTSNRVTPLQVRAARDAGANEFVSKPFSVGSLFRSLARIYEDPLPFVETPVYAGPCRRRRREKIEIDERRNQAIGAQQRSGNAGRSR
jgi:CheY-like chemotaxis protein